MIENLINSKFTTLVDLLSYRAVHQPHKLAFRFLQGGEVKNSNQTYQQLEQKARAIAAQLQSQGMAKGELALLMYPPGLEFVAAFFGCLYTGVIAVPAYPPHLNRPMPRLQAIVADTKAKAVLTTKQILSNGKRLFTYTPELSAMQWLATDSISEDLAANWRSTDVTSDTLAFLQYTSGSTSTPKGVMVSHGNLLHNERLIQAGFEHNEESIVVGWLPLFHDMGLIGNMLQPLYLGISSILMPPVAFLQNPVRWLEAISQYKATTSGGPNFAYELCINKITPEQRATLDLSSWQVAFNGAEPIRAETLERFASTFADCGFRRSAFYPCYGMAETTLIVSGSQKASPPVLKTVDKVALVQNRVVLAQESNDATQILVSSGQPLLDLQVIIANPETMTCSKPSEIGEIWVAGKSVTQGYWNRTEQTQQTFDAYLKDTGAGPFLRTGDLGFLQDGELFVTGRLKDLIIIRGRNHYPQDIEQTVENSHMALQPTCSAAFAIDVAGEERLVVAVELKRSHLRSVDFDEVMRAIRYSVAENHELQVYGILLLKPGSIPKTSSGKIQRYASRAGFMNQSLDVVASNILEETYTVESKDSLNWEDISTFSFKERQSQLESYLLQQAAKVLKIPSSQLDLQQPLTTLGMDSLSAIELKNNIETQFGIALSFTNFLQGDCIAEIANQVLAQLTEKEVENKEILLKSSPNLIENTFQGMETSYGQRALWFLHQLAPESPAYNVASAVLIKTEIDISALHRAFTKLVQRHPALRTTFDIIGTEPIQHIHQHLDFCFQREDASIWSEDYLKERLSEEAHRPFNLEQGPLLRVNLFAKSEQENILLLVVHHIITDFWSLAILAEELGILYQAEKDGVSASLAPLMFSYTDYCQAVAKMLSSSQGERLETYWQQQLAGELPILNLPTDRPRPPIQTYRGASVPLKLSAELTQKLLSISSDCKATLYMTLLAAYQVLLYRYTGQQDILVGSPTAARSSASIALLMGYFVNPVVLRSHISSNSTFKEFLTQVRQTVLDALEHQDYPFALLVERLQPLRDASRTPIFQTMFALQKAPKLSDAGLTAFALGLSGAKMHLSGLELESQALEQRVAQFDLTLTVAQVNEGLTASFEYNSDLFDLQTISRMANHWQKLLEAITENPQQCISTLPLLTVNERQTQLLEWNATQTDYPKNFCIHQLFEAQVEKTPDAIAVETKHLHQDISTNDSPLNYRQLNQRANQLAHHLQKLGVTPEIPVGICIERSLQMVVGVLGILKAGGTYVPLDPKYPKERLNFMLSDAGVSILLTQKSLVSNLPTNQARVICLDADWEIIAQESTDNPVTTITSANLAYIIYTSGSTGQPKGVMIPHHSIVNRLVSGIERYQLTINDRILQKTSFSFDVSVWEIFGALLSGACLVMAKPGGHQDPRYLVQVMAEQQITIVDFVPAMLQHILEEPGLDACTALRYITCGSEALPAKLLERFFTRLPGVELHNCYGPTEVSIDATSWVCTPDSAVISIGRPIANQQVYILDEHLQPVPIGVSGELYVGGAGLARGYLNRPELTAEKFIPHPFNPEAGARLYKTGDLARFLPDGNIEFLGRIDDQVKIRGLRLETAEIEAVLRRHPGIAEAAVLVKNDASNNQPNKRLVAYLVSKERNQQIEFWPSVGEYPLYDELLYNAMTSDIERNQRYQHAINELVRDKVVVEIGTGQDAILARFCIEGGAKKVYAIEAGEEAYHRATELVKRLGLEAKIILIHGYSTEIELPEKADICVSEIIGTIGGSEGVASILNNARRFLKEDGWMIPHRCITKIAAISLPDELRENPGFNETPAHYVHQIFEQVGHPFDLRLCIKNFPKCYFISDSAVFEDLAFTNTTETEYSQTITLNITKQAKLDGFLLWINLYTSPGVILDNLEQENSNWLPVYFPVFHPSVEVYPGDIIQATSIGKLSDNNINPDYHIQGKLIKENGEVIPFTCNSLHHQQVEESNPFNDLLFGQGKINVRKGYQKLSPQSIRAYLSQYLPDYMIPSAFVSITELPRTPNGKLDHRALPAPDTSNFENENFVPPSNPIEEVLAGMWSEILQVERVGIHNNFFELGGHSLLAIQFISKIRETFGVELRVHNMFESTTIAKLSQILIARESRPGQMEKIARVFQKVAAMSKEDVKKTLQNYPK
jgi:amino acid adenylation domain-containing protein